VVGVVVLLGAPGSGKSAVGVGLARAGLRWRDWEAELLEAAGEAFVVRLDVSEEEALRRIEERARGRHLSDAPDVNRDVWRAFHEHVMRRVHTDLVVDTSDRSVDAIIAEIVTALPADVRPDL
jgi:shikimate kinase